eukprot:SAG31_NODE_1773_length_7304_cov_2.180380_4_plen_51_part_00
MAYDPSPHMSTAAHERSLAAGLFAVSSQRPPWDRSTRPARGRMRARVSIC